ncbi:MAG: hypothetical protein MPN21_13700 [Thermoanaerobaculia bacterium]|nr:hypothetical protein [Thermoanaerobaculia bacterium]
MNKRSRGRAGRALLWLLAVLLMLAAVIYQRRTGPTYPLRGDVTISGETISYRLIRSEETIRDARVALPDPGSTEGWVVYKRYKTEDEWTRLPMQVESLDDGREMAAYLPPQPAAGKLEYYVELRGANGKARIPNEASTGTESKDGNIIIRFKDPVPLPLLLSHVLLMFFSVLVGMRTGLAALFAPRGMRGLAWTTLVGMTVGGMVLGPFVQKYAFGKYWTGFPWGFDLTDNKMLIMWIAWVLACSTIGLKASGKETVGRAVVIAATLVMMVVYLIPHSMRGSELDYAKLDSGVAPSEAVGTGD